MAGLVLPRTRAPRKAVQLLVGLVLAAIAAVAAPSSTLLPGPHGGVETVTAAIAFAAVFTAGLVAPAKGFYGVIVLTALEGAIRKWLYNDVVVFLLKDFLLIGVYTAVLPRLSWREWRRPWWLVMPLALLLVLALVQAAHNPSHTGALVGLRSYLVYVPLLWVAPAVVDGERRARLLLGVVVGLGVIESGLGIAQALVGPGMLNKLVSGAPPALLTVAGHAYLRPPGTFMQVANLADFLVFVALAGFALLSWKRGGWGRHLAVLAFVFLGGAIVYTAARTLLASIVMVVVPAIGFLLFRRRWRAALVGPAALATGLVLMTVVVPYANANVWPTVHSWFATPLAERPLVPLKVPIGGKLVVVRVWAEGAEHRSDGSVVLRGFDSAAREITVAMSESSFESLRKAGGEVASAAGATVSQSVGKPVADTNVAGGFLGRAADIQQAGSSTESTGTWSDRIRPQLSLIAKQRLAGHGTGTMTLGLEYVNPGGRILAESSYAKVAWELGLAGLVLFIWFLAALLRLALRGFVLSSGWENACAAVGIGAAVLVPLWMVITFALDFPIVGELYFVFVGLAVAAGIRARLARP
jgi:hypothetical protein